MCSAPDLRRDLARAVRQQARCSASRPVHERHGLLLRLALRVKQQLMWLDLASQAAKKLKHLREELVDPWLMPPPAPLTDTLPPAQLADVDSRFIDVNGIKLHFKQVGSDTTGTAVLLLHGFNGSVFNW